MDDTHRIIKSRQTLARYAAMPADLGVKDIPLMAAEIEVLERIAADDPATAGKLSRLVERWREQIARRSH